MEYVQQRNIEKLTRFLDKGLDPNFHDPDTGGEDVEGKKLQLTPKLSFTSIFNLLALSLFFPTRPFSLLPPPSPLNGHAGIFANKLPARRR